MLQLRPGCECCDRDLPPDSRDALICSFECTWCRECAGTLLGDHCPNCSGELQPRPIRPDALLAKHPASTERRFQSGLAEGLRGRNAHDFDLIMDDRPVLEEALEFRRSAREGLEGVMPKDELDAIYGADSRSPRA